MITLPPTSQNLDEFHKLLIIYREKAPKRVLEIGTHEGGTLYYWFKHAPLWSTIASIDLQGIIDDERANDWKRVDTKYIYYKGESQTNSAVDWARDNIAPIDWLFIDGGHSISEVTSDFINYEPLVREGGLIAFHDILPHPNSEVDILWEAIKNDYKTEEIVESHKEWGQGPGIGIIYL